MLGDSTWAFTRRPMMHMHCFSIFVVSILWVASWETIVTLTNALTTTPVSRTLRDRHYQSLGGHARQSFRLSLSSKPIDSQTIAPTTTADGLVDGKEIEHVDAVVCGGGPAGLLSAIMLAEQRRLDGQEQQQAMTIHVVESNPIPPPAVDDEAVWCDFDRFYSLGVFGRGKKALQYFGCWDDVVPPIAQELVGSQVWRNNSNPVTNSSTINLFKDTGREHLFALPRDKLVSALYQHIQTKYPNQIVFHFGQRAEPVDFEHDNKSKVLLEVSPSPSSLSSGRQYFTTSPPKPRYWTTDFLVGADGAARTVANRMEEVEREEWKQRKNGFFHRLFAGRPFSVTRYVDDNPKVYKTIPLQLPHDWRRDIGYTASDPSRRFTVVTLPSNNAGGLCGVLLMTPDEPLAQADTDPAAFRKMLNDHIPTISGLVSDEVVASVAKKPVSQFPFFRYAGPRLHKGERTVILGDACHSVKPYNGLGVNSAFEDVRILSDCLKSKPSYKEAVQEFSKVRAKDCKAIVKLSRSFDRPGRLGKLKVLVPLLMDVFFHKALPSLFEPPIPGLIHNDKYRFHQVVVRKRWERLAQVSILSASGFLATRLATTTVRTIAKALGRQVATVSVGMLVSLAGLLVAWKQFGAKKTS